MQPTRKFLIVVYADDENIWQDVYKLEGERLDRLEVNLLQKHQNF